MVISRLGSYLCSSSGFSLSSARCQVYVSSCWPSLHGYDAYVIFWAKGAFRRNRRLKYCKTSFSPFRVFLLSRNSLGRFWSVVVWHLWARHPGPSLLIFFFLKFFNVGGLVDTWRLSFGG